jgi:dTDP-4-dehydrorhamnose reductase
MRTLVLGGTGLIGGNVLAACDARHWPAAATSYRRTDAGFLPLDVCDAEAVRDVVADVEPEVSVFAAGFADAGYAAARPQEAEAVAVGGIGHAVEAVRHLGGTFVMISSDQVTGECRASVREDDAVLPTTPFGKLTAEAEGLVRTALPGRHLIVRTSCVFGPEPRPRSSVGRWFAKLACGESLDIPERTVQPTYAPDLAAAVLDLLERGYTGTFHIVGPDRMPLANLARTAAYACRADADLIRVDNPAEGWANTPWLDRAKLRSLLGPRAVRPAGDGLRALRSVTPLTAARAA